MNIPFRQVLEWNDFRRCVPGKDKGLCLFSDGSQFRVGWWSKSERRLWIPNGDGTNSIMDHEWIEVWTALPNITEDMFKFFERIKEADNDYEL